MIESALLQNSRKNRFLDFAVNLLLEARGFSEFCIHMKPLLYRINFKSIIDIELMSYAIRKGFLYKYNAHL